MGIGMARKSDRMGMTIYFEFASAHLLLFCFPSAWSACFFLSFFLFFLFSHAFPFCLVPTLVRSLLFLLSPRRAGVEAASRGMKELRQELNRLEVGAVMWFGGKWSVVMC